MSEYITAEEAGRILGEKARSVIRMVETGLLRGRVMVAREHVEAIAMARRVRQMSEREIESAIPVSELSGEKTGSRAWS